MPLPAITKLTKKDSDSLFFKAAAFLNRTNSAAMGLGTELLAGGDPVEAVTESLKGTKTYGGQDILAQLLGGSPDDKLNRRAGLALDILNPLDPLNYVGVGGLTKLGKGAKLIGGLDEAAGLMKGIGAQTKAGQRGLVTFAGMKVPIPGDAALMGLLGKGGAAVAATKPAQGIKKLFGGAQGYLEATLAPALKREGITSMDQILQPHKIADRVANTFAAPAERLIAEAKRHTKRSEYPALRELMDRVGGDQGTLMEAKAKFIGSDSGAARRKKAVDAIDEFYALRKETAAGGDPTGIGKFAEPDLGFASRMLKFKSGAPDPQMINRFYGDIKTGEKVTLEGVSDNHINRQLLVDSTQPISYNTLTTQGQREFDRLISNDPEHFIKQAEQDPKAYAEWTRKFRLPAEVLDQKLRDFSGDEMYLQLDPIHWMRDLQRDLSEKLRVNTLIKEFDRAGLAKPWDEIAEAEKSKFVRVDQGDYKSRPIGVPAIHEQAFEKFKEAYMPSPAAPMLGEMAKNLLPQWLQGLGIMPWWKTLSIYGGGPGYFNRNFITGVSKNIMDGMGPQSLATHYPEAAKLMAQSVTRGLDPAKFKGEWVVEGVPFDYRRLMEEYQNRAVHGGGSREGVLSEIATEGDSLSSRVREKVFHVPHAINASVEILNRMPLFMKTVEDTFKVARARGMQLPARVGPLSETPETIGDLIDVAFTNGREAVIRQHFDYNDLSPFERKLRAGWIPFYSWSRKNIPNETMRMIHDSGKYMPFVRYYYNSFEQQGVTPEDLPEWAGKSFAAPIEPDDDERARWLDWTGFLPMLDIAELGQAAFGTPETGKTRASQMVRYLAIRGNPFVGQFAEQGLQKSFFTGRSFSGDTPADFLGQPIGADKRNLLNLLRPAVELDRLNPGDVFGATPRPHRNEPGQVQRIERFLFGTKVRATDRDEASMSITERQRHVSQLRRDEQRELKAGNQKGAEFIRERRLRLEKGLR